MEALQAILSRNSAARLTGDVSRDAIDVMVQAGLRAPDHARLRPWKILVVEGAARERLGDLFVRAKRARDSSRTEEDLEKLKCKPLRAPVIFVVAASLREHPKVPEIEQYLSAGAVVQNMSQAAHALGLGAMWRTGGMAYDRMVHDGLGFTGREHIVGFLYVGQVDGQAKAIAPIETERYVSFWTG